jgi:hypothetical protein
VDTVITVQFNVDRPITAQRLQLPTDTSLKNIILQVGSNDCVNHNFDIEAFGEDYLNLVKTLWQFFVRNCYLKNVPFSQCPSFSQVFQYQVRLGGYRHYGTI